METQERAFLQNYRRYNALKRTHVVLPRIADKLDYLARAILNEPQIADLKQTMDSDEADALDTLDHYTKLKLFISISDCLLGRDSPTQAVPGFLREGKLSSWQACYVSYDSEQLYLTTDKKKVYRIAGIKVVKGPHRKSDRFAITLEIERGRIAQLGFNKESYLTRLYHLLSNKEQTNLLNRPTLLEPSFSEFSMVGNLTKLKNQRPRRGGDEQVQQETPSKTEELQSANIGVSCSISHRNEAQPLTQLNSLQKQIIEEFSLSNILEDYGFKLLEVMRNGRILSSENHPSVCRLCMTLESSNIHSILTALSTIPSWNYELEESKVVSRVQPNSYIYYERIKSHGITTRKRDFVFLRQGIRINERVFLLDRSVEHANFPPMSRVARGTIKQRITALVPHHDNNKLTLMVVQMDIDYGGYSSAADGQHQSTRILKGYTSLNQYLDQRTMHKLPDLLYCFDQSLGKHYKHTSEVYASNIKKHAESQLEMSIPNRNGKDQLVGSPSRNRVYRSAVKNGPEISFKSEAILQLDHEASVQSREVTRNTQPSEPQLKQLANLMTRFQSEQLGADYLELITKHNQHESLCLKHAGGLEELAIPTPLQKNTPGLDNFIFQGGDWSQNQNNQFVFVNQAVMDAQKDVVKWIIRKIGTNLISGKSIMNMSLPVDIFDKRGLLERSAGSFGYAPIFLEQAAKLEDELEQMKWVVTYMLSINTLELRLEKPFNPILGETFQAYIGTTPIQYEQISHHPPISAYYMKNDSFEMYGNLVSYAELGLNSGAGGNAGLINIKFPINQSHFECSLPSCEINGLVFGDRKMRMVGRGFILNRSKRMLTEISFGKDKKGLYDSPIKMGTSDIAGGIFTVTDDFIKKFNKATNRHRWQGLVQKDVVEKHCEVKGMWNDWTSFDGKKYKTMLDPAPFQVEYERTPLPSNSNFREDIIYLRMGNMAMSQQAKEHLEQLQRADKKLRGTK